MAFRQNLTPFSWTPTAQSTNPEIPGTIVRGGGTVDAGDWRMVSVSFRQSNAGRAVAYAPGYFLIHVLFTPDTDDSTPHEDMSVTYGGTVANRKRTYHIDPGVWFQAPSRGQLSIIAGGESEDVVVDVVVSVILSPRDMALLRAQERQLLAAAAAEADSAFIPSGVPIDSFGDEFLPDLFENNNASALVAYAGMSPAMSPTPPRKYAPPVVGTPQKVPATWVAIPLGTAIPFPDGANQVEAVDASGVAGNPIRFAIVALGNTLALDVTPGIPRSIGAYGQGFACSDGTRATLAPAVNLNSMTIWSSLGG